MSADGISLSAVGIGDGAEMHLMESIATVGAGRAYFTNDFNAIPQIFTREALRASRSMLIERLVQPTAIARDPSLAGIDTDELPVLTGYVATTPRRSASTLIISDSGDPILAKWRYGLGRTAAFTSEPKPRWAEDWVEWEDYARFRSQLVRSVTGQDLKRKVHVESSHRLDGAAAILIGDIRDSQGNYVDDCAPELTAVTADGRTRALQVSPQGPGLFEARLSEFGYGQDQQFVWRVRARTDKSIVEATAAAEVTTGTNGPENPTPSAPAASPMDAGEASQTSAYAFVYSFSPEFAALGPSAETLDRIRARGLGEVTSVGQARFVPEQGTAAARVTLWPYLLIAALMMTPLDILVRRLG